MTKYLHLFFTAIFLFFGLNVYSDVLANLNFQLQGLQDNDRSVVSLGSESYLDTKIITENGNYSFENIPPGEYFIKVEANGYNLPAAQAVIVHKNGTVDPIVGINLTITKMSENPNQWIHSWSEDVSNSGYTTTAYINNPPTIEFLGKKIVTSDVPFSGVLQNSFNIFLSDEEEIWTQEYAYRMVETLKTLPCFSEYNMAIGEIHPAKFILTDEYLYEDIEISGVGENEKIVRISKSCFTYANPFIVNFDGVRGTFFSKRLHHALVNFATDFGKDLNRVNTILRERFGCTTEVPDYSALTASTTNEDAGRFQPFNPGELVSIINMFEELPEGFHKTPHLNYLIRRLNGLPHPLYPNAAAVAWPIDNGYIEFMETAFDGDANNFETLRLILHEKTHFLWAYVFSEEIKNDWIELGGWYRDPNSASGWSTTKETEFVSAYAHAINPDEDMAESVAHYLKNPELLQSRSLPKFEFIRDRIMHGVRYISKIPDHLTFEVLNLYPDYDYPGKIKRLEVKVEGAPDEDKTITVEIELNNMEGFDDGAIGGGTRITSPIFIDDEGQRRSQFVDIGFSPVNGNAHLLRGSAHISKYSKAGYWTAGDIIVNDIQGNQRFQGRNDCVWNMYVSNPLEDLETPKYEENSLNYQVIDTLVDGHNAQYLRITYKLTDNIGISDVYSAINRDGAAHSTDGYGVYNSDTHTATIDMFISEFQPSGYYWVVSAIFADSARNGKYVYFSDSPNDQPIQKIWIDTIDPDTIAPEVDLNRMTVFAEPTNPENPDGETLVTINYYARDNKSGLGLVGYILRDPQGISHFNYHYHRNFYTQYFDGDPTVWERYTISCVLPQGSAPGIWGLAELTVLDKVQNGRTYNFVETLIFEPDNSSTDYILFAEFKDDNDFITLEIKSDTIDYLGFNYRIINDETGQEISGEFIKNLQQKSLSKNLYGGDSSNSQNTDVDISNLPDGKLIIIVEIFDDEKEIIGVRSTLLIKQNPTFVSEIKNQKIIVYPNPTKNYLYINSETKVKKVELYSLSGKMMLLDNHFTDKISISNMPNGVYLLKTYTDKDVNVSKVIKE